MTLINTGPHIVNEKRFLTDLEEPYHLIYIIILFFIGINVSLLVIFFKLRTLRHDSIPGLGSQMTSNIIVIPFIFFSTVFMAAFTIGWHMYTTNEGQGYTPFYYMLTSVIDNLLNNIAMYLNIFGRLEDAFSAMQSPSELLDSSDDVSEELVTNARDVRIPRAAKYVWIAIPDTSNEDLSHLFIFAVVPRMTWWMR